MKYRVCPKCKHVLDSQCVSCYCGYVFEESKNENIDSAEVDNKYEQVQPEYENKKSEESKKRVAQKVWHSSGRGRKQCPNCNVYVPAISFQCVCGHVFQKKDKSNVVSRAKTVWDEPGRGRKQCAHCGKYYGAKSKICPNCNKPPEIIAKKTIVSKSDVDKDEKNKPVSDYTNRKENVPNYDFRVTRLFAPSGKCPVKLTDIQDESSIENWAIQVRELMLNKKNVYLTKDALKYWARDFVDIFSDDYKRVCAVIDGLDEIY